MAAITLLLVPSWSAGAIYRCANEDGIPTFSQFPCAGQSARSVMLDALTTVHIPPLSEAQQRRLADIEARTRDEQERRSRAAARRAEDRNADRAARESRCDAARMGLNALARQRRKGYSLQEARALDRRESELDAAVRQNC